MRKACRFLVKLSVALTALWTWPCLGEPPLLLGYRCVATQAVIDELAERPPSRTKEALEEIVTEVIETLPPAEQRPVKEAIAEVGAKISEQLEKACGGNIVTCSEGAKVQAIADAIEPIIMRDLPTHKQDSTLRIWLRKFKGVRPFVFFLGALAINVKILDGIPEGSWSKAVLLVGSGFVGNFMNAAFDPFMARMRQLAIAAIERTPYAGEFVRWWRQRQGIYTNVQWDGVAMENAHAELITVRLNLSRVEESLIASTRHIAIAARRYRRGGMQFDPDDPVLTEEFSSIIQDRLRTQESIDLIVAHLYRIEPSEMEKAGARQWYATLLKGWMRSATFEPNFDSFLKP